MGIDDNLLLGIAAYSVVVLIVFWVAMVMWAYRDMRSRSRDALAQLFVGAVVAVLNIPGLLVYLLLRPRETLSEAYERSLEEEALLQEIEEKPNCPGCGQRVHDDWQACAYCHTRLKKACFNCHNLLELSWNLCPYCATSQYQPDDAVVQASRHVQVEPPPAIPDKWLAATPTSSRQGNDDYPQYVDD